MPAHDVRPERPSSPRTIVWLLANALDCDALSLWCQARVPCDAVETIADLDGGFRLCQRMSPRLLVLDPAMSECAIGRGLAAVQARIAGHLLVLDRRPREGRLVELLAEARASYMSRLAGPAALVAAIESIFSTGGRVIDPALQARLCSTPRGYAFQEPTGRFTVAHLSLRERQVMRLLAKGRSVAHCADSLGLAPSTIENHKARLMKKLGIHRASELTVRAIQDGLIAV